jgi:hypothetical protein
MYSCNREKSLWQRGCRDPAPCEENMGVSVTISCFGALTTCGKPLPRRSHYADDRPESESSDINVWHRRTPQMYTVVESDPPLAE